MKLEVGMYVRTKELLNDVMIVKVLKVIDYGFNADNDMFYVFSEVIKASHNIIDLVEVGDYVNGYLVTDVYRPTGDEVFRIEIERDTLKGHIIDNSNQIKTILTKEQIEQYTYKIGDE